jgi:enoyl-CoA hydratase/carnithine racemase
MTLQDVLVMEYRLSQRCAEDHDFCEGVRAGRNLHIQFVI